MRRYEMMIILDPTLEEQTVQPSLDQFLSVVTTGAVIGVATVAAADVVDVLAAAVAAVAAAAEAVEEDRHIRVDATCLLRNTLRHKVIANRAVASKTEAAMIAAAIADPTTGLPALLRRRWRTTI